MLFTVEVMYATLRMPTKTYLVMVISWLLITCGYYIVIFDSASFVFDAF